MKPDTRLWIDEFPAWDAALLERLKRRGELQENQATAFLPGAQSVWKTRVEDEWFERWLNSDGMITILSESGDKLWIIRPPEISLEQLTAYLLGPALGYVVYLRNMLCLHASAVLVNGWSIGLMGFSGAGKSTTSAALARMGYPLISEDHLALARDGARWMAQPGYPIVRLWPESASILGLDQADLPPLFAGVDKRYLDLAGTSQLADEPAPLAKLYAFQPRVNAPDAPRLQPLNAQERLMAVARNSYTTIILNKAQKSDEFKRLAQLAADAPVCNVTAHSDPARLPDLCDLIIQDARKEIAQKR